MAQQSWSVGILCYNEAGTIVPVVEETLRVLQQISDTHEVIVVDDGSTDGSSELLQQLGPKHAALRIISHPRNLGLGAGLHTVYNNALCENLILTAGDGQFAIAEILPYATVPDGSFVSFYRKQKTDYSLFRQVLTKFNRWLNTGLVGINLKDVNWAKIYKTKDIQQLDLQLQSSLVESEICAKLIYLGRTVKEVPSESHPRTYGKSKGSFSKMVKQALSDTFVLVKVMKAFKRSRQPVTAGK